MATSTGSSLASAVGYFNAARSAEKMADQQTAGTTSAIDAVNNIYGQTSALTLPYATAGAAINNSLVGATTPYINAGIKSEKQLQKLATGNVNVSKYLDPSMKFAMEQGQRALEASASARGGVLSGATLKDITQYASGLASQNWQNAFQNAITEKNQQAQIASGLASGGLQAMQPLSNIGSQGIQAVGIQAQAGSNTGNQLSTLNQNLGNIASNATAQKTAAENAALNQLAGSASGGFSSYVISDERTKMNVSSSGESIFDMLYPTNNQQPSNIQSTLDSLQPKEYNYTPAAQQQLGAPAGRQIGVMAQNLEQTPAQNLVMTGADGVKRIDVPKATNFALAALAEMNQRINKMEKGG